MVDGCWQGTGLSRPPTPVALISGADSAIGLLLAREFAARGHALVMLGPARVEVEELACALQSEFNVRVLPLAIDMEQDGAEQQVERGIAVAGMRVEWLVNSAGYRPWGRFWETPLDRHLSAVRLNIEAALRLTARFLPGMIGRGHGRLLNTAWVANAAGTLPAIYHASRAFMRSWSEALALELRGTGVSVTALCPDPDDPDLLPYLGTNDLRGFSQAPVLVPRQIAAAGYRGLMAGVALVVPGDHRRTPAYLPAA